MPFRPNYRQARGERNRAKQQKKNEKLRRRELEIARRKAVQEPEIDAPPLETPDEPLSGTDL
jgi:hypothetical protein